MIVNDIKFALRTLRKNPAFTVTAVLTIALGIGASTAIFSVVNGLLLRPLPYVHPERLATIQTDMVARNVRNFPIGPGTMPDLWQQLPAFESIAGINSGQSTYLGDDGKPDQIVTAGVTTNFFNTLGARVVFGRNFVESDGTPPPPPPPGQAPGAAPFGPPQNGPPAMTILSYEFWQRRFAGDSAVIGKTVQVNGRPAQIVGVAEPGLKLLFRSGNGIAEQPDLYSAFRIDWTTASRNNVFLRVFGRLKPNASWAAVDAQMRQRTADEQSRFPIAKTANVVFRAQPMSADIVHDVRPAILSLMGAVIFVLLIACANVANLLLVRASARERELAVRAALGGNRRTLIGQMLAESLVLAVGGAALGLIFARFGIDLLLRIAPSTLPRLDDVNIDMTVLLFVGGTAVLSAVVFGMLPALRASRPNLSQTLRAGGRSPGLQSGKTLRQAVVVAEVALSFVLLIGSGLMLRSFMALERVDPGFDPRGVLTFTAFNARLRTPDESRAYGDALQRELAAIPGVTSVTAASPLPLDGADFNLRWGNEEAATDPAKFHQATAHFVRLGYFKAMHSRILAGSDFGPADNDTSSRGLIIDNLLAAKAFPGVPLQNVVGRSLLARISTPEALTFRILGVAEHERHLTLAEPGREAVFVPEGVIGFGSAGRWAVRTSGDPTRLVADVRRVVNSVDARVAIGEIKPMSDYVDRAMAPTRFSLVLIGIFGVVAAVLAAVGLYGVLSTTVRQRTAEIGVRLAFGATSQNIFGLIVGQGLALSAAGIVAGLLAAMLLTGVMQKASMLVAVRPTDPLTYAAIALLFVVIATVSCWVPARRAAALDPNVALREE
jgi:predicted permease